MSSSYDQETQHMLDEFNSQLADMEGSYKQAVAHIAVHGLAQPTNAANAATAPNLHTQQKIIATVAAFADVIATLRTTPVQHVPGMVLRAVVMPVANRFNSRPVKGKMRKPKEAYRQNGTIEASDTAFTSSTSTVIDGTFRVVTDDDPGAPDTRREQPKSTETSEVSETEEEVQHGTKSG